MTLFSFMARRDFKLKRLLACHPIKENKMYKFLEWLGVIALGIVLGCMFAYGF